MVTPKKGTTPKASPVKTTAEKPTDSATKATGAKKSGPSFDLVRIGPEKPEQELMAKGPRRLALIENLRKLQDTPGEWLEVAQSATPGGAASVIQAAVEGKWTMPEGPGEYDLDERRRNV